MHRLLLGSLSFLGVIPSSMAGVFLPASPAAPGVKEESDGGSAAAGSGAASSGSGAGKGKKSEADGLAAEGEVFFDNGLRRMRPGKIGKVRLGCVRTFPRGCILGGARQSPLLSLS